MRCGLALRYRLAMLFICVAVAASAAVEKPDSLVRGLFLSLSDSQLGILPKTTRQDMLDYLDADSLATRPNAFRIFLRCAYPMSQLCRSRSCLLRRECSL